jgi:hypothetical protein
MIATARIHQEINALGEVFDMIEYNPDDGITLLRDFSFPDGWSPPTEDIMLSYPDAYPHAAPRIYVREEMRYEGKKPAGMSTRGPDGWNEYHLSIIAPNRLFGGGEDPIKWDPEKHTALTILRLFESSLNDPHSDGFAEDT